MNQSQLNTGNAAIADRKYPAQELRRHPSVSNGNYPHGDGRNGINQFDDDSNGVYFSEREVPNETVHTYEVTQAKPEIYGKATVIRHGKRSNLPRQ